MKKGILKSRGSLNQTSVLVGHKNSGSENKQYTGPGFEQVTFQCHSPTWVRIYSNFAIRSRTATGLLHKIWRIFSTCFFKYFFHRDVRLFQKLAYYHKANYNYRQNTAYKSGVMFIFSLGFFFPPNAPLVLDGLRGLPSWGWQKCNRLPRLGRPWGAVTLSRWCEWWYRRM